LGEIVVMGTLRFFAHSHAFVELVRDDRIYQLA